MLNLKACLLGLLLFINPMLVTASDFYVITSSHKNQAEAQKTAVTQGGWILNTDFYNKLTPHLFAVVRGPFKTKLEAEDVLKTLHSNADFKDSYVSDAGTIQIDLKIKNKNISPHIIAALLGELVIDITEEQGGENPCLPQEPYKNLTLGYYESLPNTGIVLKQLDIGGFWQLKQTGEIERMHRCLE